MELANAFLLLFRGLYYFGLMPFKFSDDKSQIITTFVDRLTILVSFLMIALLSLFGIAVRKLVETIFDIQSPSHSSEVILMAQWMQVCISGLAYAGVIILSNVKKTSHMKIYELWISLDRDMMKFFNFDPNYGELQMRLNVFVLSLIAYNGLLSFCLVVYITYMNNNYLDNRMLPIYAGSQTYPQFHCVYYCVVIIFITRRLKAVENLAKSNLTKEEFNNLVNINQRLRQIVYTVNEALGLGEFLIIVNNNIIITLQIFVNFHMLSSKEMMSFYLHWSIGSTWWLMVFVAQTVYTAKVGNDLKVQVWKTNQAILENSGRQKFEDKNTELMLTCTLGKLYGNKVECTAGGFFVIDNSLITLMVSTITSYLIILMQFQQSENQ